MDGRGVAELMTTTQIINAANTHGGPRFISDKAYALTEDARVVPDGDPASRFVLVGKGGNIPLVLAQACGLTGTQGEQVNARRAVEAADGTLKLT